MAENENEAEERVKPMPADDDFFGSQDDDDTIEQERRTRELEALRRPHYTAGVRHGVSAAHEANVQGGFDVGFTEGAQAAAEPAFLYVVAHNIGQAFGAGSVVLAFFSKNGCFSRSEADVQKMDDTEVPTNSLKDLQRSVFKLRNEVRTLVSDRSASTSTTEAKAALSNVSFVEVPPSARSPSGEEK